MLRPVLGEIRFGKLALIRSEIGWELEIKQSGNRAYISRRPADLVVKFLQRLVQDVLAHQLTHHVLKQVLH
jgi:hypothetical protein